MEKQEKEVTDLVSKAMAEKAVSQMKRSKRVYGDYTPAKGEMTANIVLGTLANLDQAISRPKCEYGDLNTAKERTQEYLIACSERQLIPTMEGWAIALGIGRKSLYNWFNEVNAHQDKQFNEFIMITRDAIMSVMSQSALQKNIDTVRSIFYGKNFYGMSDKTEITVAPPASPFGENSSPEELQQKYLIDTAGDYEDLDSEES